MLGRRFAAGDFVLPGGVAVAVALAGRCAAGPTFGAVVWVAMIVPWASAVFAGSLQRGEEDRHRRSWVSTTVSAVACLPLVNIGPAVSWWVTAGWVAVWTASLVRAAEACGRVIDREVAVTLLTVGWFGWWTLPLTIPAGSPLGVWAVEHSPGVELMGLWPGLGDWTHQALAYHYLTRLGQDVPFAPPGVPAVSIAAGVAAWLAASAVSHFLRPRASVPPCST